ncbi:MAG: alpha-L-fucosidase [Clostridiaceae bacterium]|nr:alpha-L-fucosidase [Clostridiaceae bacterium]
MTDFIKQAAHVKPSANQLRLLTETPFYAFIHFSPNTYTGLEWGTGDEDPSIFNPVNLDCDGWCMAIKSAGMKGIVITAKHHDGFCLWQTKYTDHSMKSSPYKNGKGDIVGELSDACRRHRLKFGFYLSPWDRNSKLYGTEEYNDFYKAQLTELLTNYGEIFHVWFDGACGEGPDGKKQVYDFDGYFELIHKYQPNATVFNDKGPIRWCGNESGSSRYAEWSVVPSELCPNCEIQTPPGPFSGDLSFMYNTDGNIGSLSNIMYSKGLVFAPSEVDMSIRPGWFYHEDEEPHSLDRLFDTYLRSVGGNTTFILNIPPKPDGTFDERDVKRLKELGDKIRESFSVNLAEGKKITVTPYCNSDTQCTVDIELEKEEKIEFLEFCEDIAEGQRIESFTVQIPKNGGWENLFEGTTVGAKRIVRLGGIAADRLRIFVTASRDKPTFGKIAVY